ncbi:MAG: hypothetical protein ACRC3Y_16540 [Romboutsia sp.]|uniref:hypothetical protein n=1 Tax=Romboutsia sp. TaxID=1965302 RepID=UPI003F406630
MNFKFMYEGISKKIVFSILTIIQFTVVMLCVYIALDILGDTAADIKGINKYFSEGKYYRVDNSISSNSVAIFEEDEMVYEELKNLNDTYDYLVKEKGIKLLSARTDEVLVKEGEILREGIVDTERVRNGENTFLRVKGVLTNKDFLQEMNYKFIDGGFEKFVYKEGKIPVILGNMYKEKYKVGDTIKSLDDEKKEVELEVVGILNEKNYLYEDGLFTVENNLENAILYPFNEKIIGNFPKEMEKSLFTYIELNNYIGNSYIKDEGLNIKEINKELLEFNIKYQFMDLEKGIEEYRSSQMESIKPIIYMTGVVILFSVISVIVVIMNSFIKDRKEFGINILIGATMNDIKNRILLEIIGLFGVSIVLFIILLLCIPILKVKLAYVVGTMTIIFLILLMVLTIIRKNLNKYSINELIRRSE